MALNPSTNTTMAGRVTGADADYPYASSKDESAPGAGDGTPYFKARANDIFGMQQALLELASITPSGDADTALVSEYTKAVVELASGRAFNYDESGVADAYILDVRSKQHPPAGLFEGLLVAFTPGATNTGASTANVAGLGAVSIKLKGGTASTPAGVIFAGVEAVLKYRVLPAPHWELQIEGDPVGTVISYAGTSAPPGFLELDASELSEMTFANLFAKIGHTWGTTGGVAAPAAGHFRLPPSEIGGLGLFIRGVGAVGVGVYEADVFKSHEHSFYTRHSYENSGANTNALCKKSSVAPPATLASSDGSIVASGDTIETRPRSITMLRCIKY